MAKKKPNFSNFGKSAESIEPEVKEVNTKSNIGSSSEDVETRHVQARLLRQDAIRFKRAAEDNGLNLHDGLVEAINSMMRQWGEPPVSNIGATKKIK